MRPEDLDESMLLRLTGDAMLMMFGCAPGYEAQAVAGAAMAVTGEPVADQNYLMITRNTPTAVEAFESYVRQCDARDLPFVSIVAPAVTPALVPVCERLELVHATDWPLMVCPGAAAQYHPADGITIRPMTTPADHAAMTQAVGGAFSMPVDVVARATPLELFDAPSIGVTLAERGGEVLSSVTSTHHGAIVGIWSMATLAEAQGKGVGKALLSKVMADCREQGASAFFLGATPAGFPLYERLGYETVCEAQVWVRGETNQA